MWVQYPCNVVIQQIDLPTWSTATITYEANSLHLEQKAVLGDISSKTAIYATSI